MKLRRHLTAIGLAWCAAFASGSALLPAEAAAQPQAAPQAPSEPAPTTTATGRPSEAAPTDAPVQRTPAAPGAVKRPVAPEAQPSTTSLSRPSPERPSPERPSPERPSPETPPTSELVEVTDAGASPPAPDPVDPSTERERELREQLEREQRLRSELERALEGERANNRPPVPGRDVFKAFNDWLWDRAEAPPPPASPPPSAPDTGPSPAAEPSELDAYFQQTLRQWLGLAPGDRFSWFGLFFLLALASLGLRLIQRARQHFSPEGFIPASLRAATLTLRLSILLLVLSLCARLLPSSLRPGLFVAMLALSAAVGFGTAWWLLPDVLSGLLLLVDSRIRRGQWIVGSGFRGRVERIGPTVTRLRTADGSVLLLPNRLLTQSPIERGVRHGYFVEVEVQAPADAPSSALRAAIREAVLCSPYVPPNPQLSITRHPQDPLRWQIRVRLTGAQFAAAFQGELLERLENSLHARARIAAS